MSDKTLSYATPDTPPERPPIQITLGHFSSGCAVGTVVFWCLGVGAHSLEAFGLSALVLFAGIVSGTIGVIISRGKSRFAIVGISVNLLLTGFAVHWLNNLAMF